jgi:hypothetical protein
MIPSRAGISAPQSERNLNSLKRVRGSTGRAAGLIAKDRAFAKGSPDHAKATMIRSRFEIIG